MTNNNNNIGKLFLMNFNARTNTQMEILYHLLLSMEPYMAVDILSNSLMGFP